MILDTGVCSVFRRGDVSEPGGMPTYGYTHLFSGWYGELSYETAPAWQTEGRKDQKADGRIRILQHREIAQDDVVIMAECTSWDERPAGATAYRITRAWHGTDDDGPMPISDLTLEVVTP